MRRVVVLLGLLFLISFGVGLLLQLASVIFKLLGVQNGLVSDVIALLPTVIGLGLTIYYGYHKRYLQRGDFSYSLTRSQTVHVFLLFLLNFILILLFNEYVMLPEFSGILDNISPPILIFFAVIIAPIGEEFFFRGMITKLLLEEYRPITAILVSTIAFSIIHFNPAQLPVTIFLGLLLGWIYYKSRSVIPCIILHFLNNTLGVICWLYLGEDSITDNNILTIILLSISLVFIPIVFIRAQVAFSSSK